MTICSLLFLLLQFGSSSHLASPVRLLTHSLKQVNRILSKMTKLLEDEKEELEELKKKEVVGEEEVEAHVAAVNKAEEAVRIFRDVPLRFAAFTPCCPFLTRQCLLTPSLVHSQTLYSFVRLDLLLAHLAHS